MSDLIDCPVGFHAGANKFGVFANAFRVVQEAGQECFLDFCVYSAQEERAEVVTRVRIHRSFIPIIEARLQGYMQELKGNHEFVVKDHILSTSSGGVVLFNPGTDETES